MEKLIEKIQEQLDNNWAVDSDDIQSLLDKERLCSIRYMYWKDRCQKAENYINESPCDPDITEKQIKAYSEWKEMIENPYGLFKKIS